MEWKKVYLYKNSVYLQKDLNISGNQPSELDFNKASSLNNTSDELNSLMRE